MTWLRQLLLHMSPADLIRHYQKDTRMTELQDALDEAERALRKARDAQPSSTSELTLHGPGTITITITTQPSHDDGQKTTSTPDETTAPTHEPTTPRHDEPDGSHPITSSPVGHPLDQLPGYKTLDDSDTEPEPEPLPRRGRRGWTRQDGEALAWAAAGPYDERIDGPLAQWESRIRGRSTMRFPEMRRHDWEWFVVSVREAGFDVKLVPR